MCFFGYLLVEVYTGKYTAVVYLIRVFLYLLLLAPFCSQFPSFGFCCASFVLWAIIEQIKYQLSNKHTLEYLLSAKYDRYNMYNKALINMQR